jgi:prolipoprotein diacylglyceryl transferase
LIADLAWIRTVPRILNLTLDPTLAQVGPWQLTWGSLFTTLGAVLALWLGWRQARARGIPDDALGRVVTGGILGGLLGARALVVLANLALYRSAPATALAVGDGALSIWGAWLGGIVAGGLTARPVGQPVWRLLDAAAPASVLGQAVGLIGALLTGAIWGAPTGGAWGLVYWDPGALLPPASLGVPSQPYPLYLSGALVALLLLLRAGRRWLGARDGRLFLATALGYCVVQWALLPLRGWPVGSGGAAIAHVASLGGIGLVVAAAAYRARGSLLPSFGPTRRAVGAGSRESTSADAGWQTPGPRPPLPRILPPPPFPGEPSLHPDGGPGETGRRRLPPGEASSAWKKRGRDGGRNPVHSNP